MPAADISGLPDATGPQHAKRRAVHREHRGIPLRPTATLLRAQSPGPSLSLPSSRLKPTDIRAYTQL
jgi:hypothetical protein